MSTLPTQITTSARRLAARSGLSGQTVHLARLHLENLRSRASVAAYSEFQDIRLSLDPTTGVWLLRRHGMAYQLDHGDVGALSSVLPMEVLDRGFAVRGSARIDQKRSGIAVELRAPALTDLVNVDDSAINLVAPVTVDPQPQVDGWLATMFRVRVEQALRVQLHTHLPEREGLGDKDYVVSRAGELIASGTLTRGARSSISIEYDCEPTGTCFDVSLAYPEPSSAAELRRLGAIVSGVTRDVPRRALGS